MHGTLRDAIHPHATKEQVKMFLVLKCALWEKTTDGIIFGINPESTRLCCTSKMNIPGDAAVLRPEVWRELRAPDASA